MVAVLPLAPSQRGKGEAGHAEVADVGGYEGGTDGAVRGDGVGFDEDGGFHCDRSYSLYVLTYFRAYDLSGSDMPGVETPG